MNRIIFNLLFLGFISIISQTILIRELLIVFSGNELTIGIIIANWVLLMAAGSALVGRIVDKITSGVTLRLPKGLYLYITLQIITALFLPVTIILIRNAKNILGIIPGQMLDLFQTFYISFIVLLPVSFCIGAMFSCGVRVYDDYLKDSTSAIGRTYAIDAIGDMLGGIVLTYFLITKFNSVEISFIIGLLMFFSCMLLSSKILKDKTLKGKFQELRVYPFIISHIPKILFVVYLAVLLTGFSNILHDYAIKSQWKNYNVVYNKNSIYGNITVIKKENQYTFFSNGLPTINIPVPDITFVEEFSHFPMLFQKQPRRILLLSGGLGGIINELLKHQVEKITYVELDPEIIKTAKTFPSPLISRELSDKRVEIINTDAGFFVNHTDEKYDLVFLNMPAPATLEINKYYTLEFLKKIKKNLTGDGILALTIPGSLIYLNLELRNLNSCIYETIKKVYPAVKIIPGDSLNLYLCSPDIELINTTPEMVIEKFKASGIKTNLLTPFYIKYRLDNRWPDWFFDSLKQEKPDIVLNYDFRPTALFHTVSNFNAMFSPKLAKIFNVISKVKFHWIIIVTSVIFLMLFIRKKSLNTTLLSVISTTGFAGMSYTIILFISFQVFFGYLYYKLGLLTALFMAGLAAGSLCSTVYANRIDKNKILKILSFIELFIILFSVFLPLILNAGIIKTEFTFFVLMLLSGFLVGLEFPLASKTSPYINTGQKAGILYAMDLAGAWLAALVISVWFIPVYGILTTCIFTALLKLFSLSMVVRLCRFTDN